MGFVYRNYEGFFQYCNSIARNHGYMATTKNINDFYTFEKYINILIDLDAKCCLKILAPQSIYHTIIDNFVSNSFEAFKSIDYMNRKFQKFFDGREDFYYVLTSLESMMGIKCQFCEEYIFKGKEDIYYPCKVHALKLTYEPVCVYTLPKIDPSFVNKKGVYFIYDSNGELSYIGKSTNCLLKRSLESVQERKLDDFSKIEYRLPKTFSDIGIYEAYYIAKNKPEKNSDMVFDDEVTIELPELEVAYSIERSDKDYIEEIYFCYSSILMETCDFLKEKYSLLETDKKIIDLQKKGVLPASEAKRKAYERCIQQARDNGIIIVKDGGQITADMIRQANESS